MNWSFQKSQQSEDNAGWLSLNCTNHFHIHPNFDLNYRPLFNHWQTLFVSVVHTFQSSSYLRLWYSSGCFHRSVGLFGFLHAYLYVYAFDLANVLFCFYIIPVDKLTTAVRQIWSVYHFNPSLNPLADWVGSTAIITNGNPKFLSYVDLILWMIIKYKLDAKFE